MTNSVVQLKLVEPAPKPSRSKPLRTLRVYAAEQKMLGVKAIPADAAVYRYAADVGIPREFLALAWWRFKDVYLNDSPDKKYRDWPAVFLRAVKGNWMKIWYFDSEFKLNTLGVQAQRAMQSEQARRSSDANT